MPPGWRYVPESRERYRRRMSGFENTFLHANPTLDEEKCTLTPDFLAVAAIAAVAAEQLCREALTGCLLRPGSLTLTGPGGVIHSAGALERNVRL